MVSKFATRKLLAGALLFVATIACEQPAGDSEGGAPPPAEKKPTLLSASVNPVYLGPTASYLRVSLNCKGYSVIEFTHQSSLTPKTTVFKQCPNSSLVQQLPVQQGTQQQMFQVKVVGYEEQPSKPSSLPFNLTKNFNPSTVAPTMVAGYGITSGGGPISGTGVTITNNSIGEVFYGTTSNVNGQARNGLQGTIDP